MVALALVASFDGICCTFSAVCCCGVVCCVGAMTSVFSLIGNDFDFDLDGEDER